MMGGGFWGVVLVRLRSTKPAAGKCMRFAKSAGTAGAVFATTFGGSDVGHLTKSKGRVTEVIFISPVS